MATFKYSYNPNRSSDWNYGGKKWKLSRSKIDLFIECPRCFYLDNKLGTKRPGMPSFNLNIAIDTLFKKEFDVHRKNKTRHPIMEEYNIDAIPFQHKELNNWRDNFTGITYSDKKTGLLVSGAIDDMWITPNKTFILVDYKSTSKKEKILTLEDSPWENQYKRQIGVYQWLFQQNGFNVEETGYFVYANGEADAESFNNTLTFETTLVSCEGSKDWIPQALKDISECLNSNKIPDTGERCEYCPYREASGKKLQALHNKM